MTGPLRGVFTRIKPEFTYLIPIMRMSIRRREGGYTWPGAYTTLASEHAGER